MSDLTYEEFCSQPLQCMYGVNGAKGASRLYRNNDLGIQKEIHTKRKRYDDIYSGWQQPYVAYFVDGVEGEFKNAAEMYEAWMAKRHPEEAEKWK